MLRLLDVSNNNGAINWDAVKAAGIAGAICKTTQGTTFVDADFQRNWEELGRLGLARGCYHFADMGDPIAEANFFCDHMPTLNVGDMCWLDQEPITQQDGSAWALAFLGRVEQRLGFVSGIYSYPSYVSNCLADARLGRYNLWLAALDYLPASIGPFRSVALWQDSWSAHVPGVNGDVDEDVIARTVAGLKLLGKPAPATPPTPPAVWRRGVTVCQGTVALKVQPSHTCAAVAGADKIADGQAIAISNDVRHTDDSWVYCQWKADYGFLLTANVKAS